MKATELKSLFEPIDSLHMRIELGNPNYPGTNWRSASGDSKAGEPALHAFGSGLRVAEQETPEELIRCAVTGQRSLEAAHCSRDSASIAASDQIAQGRNQSVVGDLK